jgi:hypothetical protein
MYNPMTSFKQILKLFNLKTHQPKRFVKKTMVCRKKILVCFYLVIDSVKKQRWQWGINKKQQNIKFSIIKLCANETTINFDMPTFPPHRPVSTKSAQRSGGLVDNFRGGGGVLTHLVHRAVNNRH